MSCFTNGIRPRPRFIFGARFMAIPYLIVKESPLQSDTAQKSNSLKFSRKLVESLERREEDKLRRYLRPALCQESSRVLVGSKELINFASNDYMALSQHPLVRERAIDFIRLYGAGSGSARLLGGNNALFEPVEEKLADLKGSEAALLFPTGYQLNATVLPTLLNLSDFMVLDRLCHASMLEGLRAEFGKGKCSRYRNNDMEHLAGLLLKKKAKAAGHGWIVTESVFGMDGSIMPGKELSELSNTNDTGLFIDEAHATGVFGEHGMGLFSTLKEARDDCIAMGTFGKGAGSFGAYLTCTRLMKEFLINTVPGFIYTTALPPAIVGAIDAALDLIPSMQAEREQLLKSARKVRKELSLLGFSTGQSCSQIIPIMTGESEVALDLSAFLEQQGIFAPAIRYPTVPKGEARIRISLTTAHSEADLEYLLNTLEKWRQISWHHNMRKAHD